MLTRLRQVAKAKETTEKIDAELKDLQATLANIEEARPFEDLTVSSTRGSSRAQPGIYITSVLPVGGGRQGAPSHRRGCRDDAQEGQVDRAWYVAPNPCIHCFVLINDFPLPGYKEKFGDLSLM